MFILLYLIWFSFNKLFFCFFAGFLLFSLKESVTGCGTSLWVSFILECNFISHLYIFLVANVITTV